MSASDSATDAQASAARRVFDLVVGQRLAPVLRLLLLLFALLSINAIYLSVISLLEAITGQTLQGGLFQYMFLAHVVLGLAFTIPALIYAVGHFRRARHRPNRRAVKAGLGIVFFGLVLVVSGLALSRGLPGITLRDGDLRTLLYWCHVAAPVLTIWLFVLHRLAGRPIRWRSGGGVALTSLALAAVGVAAVWSVKDPDLAQTSEQYFAPSLARTANAELIPAQLLMTDRYCAECHLDIHDQWQYSAHRLASFNNPAYRFSVRQTRQKMLARDGNIQGARFCAGCHDPVPFFSGAFNDPDFDDVGDVTSQAGITCVSCHAIEYINSPRGNADYVIGAPEYYPFTFSDSELLGWINRFLIKANPSFHKRTFLKPLHTGAEFCGTCHKVHLPAELNNYRWLRGQNHYDSFRLSGVSGSSVSSFYYPNAASDNCNGCHMPRTPSQGFSASQEPGDDQPSVNNHLFASGNTALGALLDHPESVFEAHQEILQGSVSIDLFGLREGSVDGPQVGPLSGPLPVLEPGTDYLLEVVLRTRTLGHLFTQGTADSNQIWLELTLLHNGEPVAVSGAVNGRGEVDPEAHFVNSFVIDRNGQRIASRNAEDIFTALYNHQIPPGAADVVFYRFKVPPDMMGELSFSARLRYRKFDTAYYQQFAADFQQLAPVAAGNPLPVVDIATATTAGVRSQDSTWRRWNDYGIGLLRKPDSGALRQAEEAFLKVSRTPGEGAAHGLINLARVYLREGRLAEAEAVLTQAAEQDLPYPWVHQWLTARLNRQNGFPEAAADILQRLTETPYQAAREAGFDFARDYRLWETLAGTYYDVSRIQRDDTLKEQSLLAAKAAYLTALAADPERAVSHYGLSRVLTALGEPAQAVRHRTLHEKYRVDDNARDVAVAAARARYPAAAVAAEPVAVYPLTVKTQLIAN